MKPLYRFRSRDGRYGVTLPAAAVDHMLAEAVKAGGKETGGILIGLYNDALDTAIVTRASSPPADSRSTATTFWRGVVGVREMLQRFWARPIPMFYLGEWHLHPFASPERSELDDDTMSGRGLRHSFLCEVPVLVILGGDPHGAWILRAWAYPSHREPVVLHELPVSSEGVVT